MKRAAGALLGLLVATPLAWAIALELVAPARVVHGSAVAGSPDGTAGRSAEMWIERGRSRQTAIEYLYAQASGARGRPLSRVLHRLRFGRQAVVPEPPLCKTLPGGSMRLALPAPRPSAGVSLQEALRRAASGFELSREDPLTVVSREHVAQVLHYANGVTSSRSAEPGQWRRAAASAGARYPTDVYAAVRDVEGIDPGIYYYHPHDHALVQVNDARALDLLAGSVGEPARVGDQPVTFLLGATFDRTVAAYSTHGYRYVTVDAGHVAANLLLAAAALGLQCAEQAIFDDQALARVARIEPGNEGALLAIACGVAGTRLPSNEAATIAVPRHETPPPPADPDLVELTRLSHRLTSWQLVPGEPREVRLLELTPGSLRSLRSPLAMPAPPSAQVDLFEAISRRRSFRRYSARPVSRELLSGVLADAVGLATKLRGYQLLELYVAAHAVSGLEPGVYRYLAGPNALDPVVPGDQAGMLERASFSQQVLGRAAFVLLWAMRTPVAERVDGVRGYRHAHLAAGQGGEVAYLSAVARGLGICGVGAFDDDAVNALVERDARGHLAVYLMGVGHRD